MGERMRHGRRATTRQRRGEGAAARGGAAARVRGARCAAISCLRNALRLWPRAAGAETDRSLTAALVPAARPRLLATPNAPPRARNARGVARHAAPDLHVLGEYVARACAAIVARRVGTRAFSCVSCAWPPGPRLDRRGWLLHPHTL
eukprot:364800-Chlamydomonas_euryale.AAC.6